MCCCYLGFDYLLRVGVDTLLWVVFVFSGLLLLRTELVCTLLFGCVGVLL